MSKNRSSAKEFLEKTEEQFKKYEKLVANTVDAEEDVCDRKRTANEGLVGSEKKLAKLDKELAGITEANQKKVRKKNLVGAMEDTALVEEWTLDDMVKTIPVRFVDWYVEHNYKVEWTGDPDGPDFPSDGIVGVLSHHLDKVLERDWKIDFGTLCDHCRNEILAKLVEMGFRIQGFKNGKYTAISTLAPTEEESGAAAGVI